MPQFSQHNNDSVNLIRSQNLIGLAEKVTQWNHTLVRNVKVTTNSSLFHKKNYMHALKRKSISFAGEPQLWEVIWYKQKMKILNFAKLLYCDTNKDLNQ